MTLLTTSKAESYLSRRPLQKKEKQIRQTIVTVTQTILLQLEELKAMASLIHIPIP